MSDESTIRTDTVRLEDVLPTRDDDYLAPDVVQDPYRLFTELLRSAPTHFNERYGAVVVTRHQDVRDGMKDARLSSDRLTPYLRARRSQLERAQAYDAFQLLTRWLVFLDPPDHVRLRRLVSGAFAAREVRRLEGTVHEVVSELLAGLEPEERCDWVQSFAYPLPVLVVSKMLGVPASDRHLLKDWSDRMSGFIFGAEGDAGRHEDTHHAVTEMAAYFRELVEHFRRSPGDNIITNLIQASDMQDRLTPDEVVATSMLLLFAGHETTTNVLANGLHALLTAPNHMAGLVATEESVSRAVEELLRYESPSKMVVRIAGPGATIGNTPIAEGTPVMLLQAAAHRDGEVFTDPAALDLARVENPHLAFGVGRHFCLGAPLARMEAAEMLRQLLRWPLSLELDGDVRWQPTLLSRGLKSLPLRVREATP